MIFFIYPFLYLYLIFSCPDLKCKDGPENGQIIFLLADMPIQHFFYSGPIEKRPRAFIVILRQHFSGEFLEIRISKPFSPRRKPTALRLIKKEIRQIFPEI